MRFPDTPFMKRTFDLAENRGLNVKLIPYIMQMVNPPNTWLLYNNARVNNQDSSVAGDPFNVRGYINDPSLSTPQAVHQKVAEVIQPFRDLFRPPPPGEKQRSIKESMDILFEQTNQFSMRSYMFAGGMNAKDIHWCETIDKSTGWYDRALTESEGLDLSQRLLVLLSDMGLLQPSSRAWPLIGPPHHSQALKIRKIRMPAGIASSACLPFPRRESYHDTPRFTVEDLRRYRRLCLPLSQTRRKGSLCSEARSLLSPATPRRRS